MQPARATCWTTGSDPTSEGLGCPKSWPRVLLSASRKWGWSHPLDRYCCSAPGPAVGGVSEK
eukprot:scaffold58267_cov90-Phaeocystis_antarctica.AAC.1